jgi:hypothetical protein
VNLKGTKHGNKNSYVITEEKTWVGQVQRKDSLKGL